MSIDKLQDKIRKMKNPSAVCFDAGQKHIPIHLLEQEGSILKAYSRFCAELMEGLKGTVPAVRLGFDAFAICDTDGVASLKKVMKFAKSCGYYVILDAPQALTVTGAENGAAVLFSEDWKDLFDGLCLSAYIGSDGIRPYLNAMKDTGKDIFVTVRTANKSARELQDLMTGGRLVYTATADMVNYLGQQYILRGGYSRVAGIGAATSADALRTLRTKYPSMFLLIDGYDYSGANAKNCSFAFDRLGRGAVACAGQSVTAAWQEECTDGRDYVAQAVEAAERMKKNLLRYIEIL